MIFVGFILVLIGVLSIFLQIKKNTFYKYKSREDFYIPPEIRGFWGLVIIFIVGGIILIFQNI
jgi:uncharacterized membrane protein